MIIEISFAAFVLYILLVFVLPHFIIPFLGFNKRSLPHKIPTSMRSEMNALKKKFPAKEKYLKETYKLLIDEI